MPGRTEIRETLAASQARVIAFFHGLSSADLERPATKSEVVDGAPWRAKDHFAHLVKSERNIQRLLRHALAGDTKDALLRLQYPPGMELPATLGDWDSLTAEEQARLVQAVARINQAYVDEHRDDGLETVTADYLAARRETLALLDEFTDDQLAAAIPAVVGEMTAGELFAGRAGHAATHLAWIEEGFRQGV